MALRPPGGRVDRAWIWTTPAAVTTRRGMSQIGNVQFRECGCGGRDNRDGRALTRGAGRPVRLLGCDGGGRFGEALDSLLDVAERLQTGFNRAVRDFLQHIRGDGITQAVEVVNKLPAAPG